MPLRRPAKAKRKRPYRPRVLRKSNQRQPADSTVKAVARQLLKLGGDDLIEGRVIEVFVRWPRLAWEAVVEADMVVNFMWILDIEWNQSVQAWDWLFSYWVAC